MRLKLSIFSILFLLSCRTDQKNNVIPKTPEKISVSVDGTRTDAVDKLISKDKVLDSLRIIKKENG